MTVHKRRCAWAHPLVRRRSQSQSCFPRWGRFHSWERSLSSSAFSPLSLHLGPLSLRHKETAILGILSVTWAPSSASDQIRLAVLLWRWCNETYGGFPINWFKQLIGYFKLRLHNSVKAKHHLVHAQENKQTRCYIYQRIMNRNVFLILHAFTI